MKHSIKYDNLSILAQKLPVQKYATFIYSWYDKKKIKAAWKIKVPIEKH